MVAFIKNFFLSYLLSNPQIKLYLSNFLHYVILVKMLDFYLSLKFQLQYSFQIFSFEDQEINCFLYLISQLLSKI